VDHLQTVFEDDSKIAVLCIYCNYKEQVEQTVTKLVTSLLKQIVEEPGAALDHIKRLYIRCRTNDTQPTLHELTTALESEIRTYSKVFIVVDALDECHEEDGTRAKFITVLQSLAGNVHLMVTSRDLPSIAREFHGKRQLIIRANDDDIKMYINGRIALAPRHLKNLRETIVSKIVANVKGM